MIQDHSDSFTCHLLSSCCSLVFAVAIVEDSQLCFIVIPFVIFIGIKHRLLKFINIEPLYAKRQTNINLKGEECSKYKKKEKRIKGNE